MPLVGFEPTIVVFEWAKTFHVLDHAVNVIGSICRSLEVKIVFRLKMNRFALIRHSSATQHKQNKIFSEELILTSYKYFRLNREPSQFHSDLSLRKISNDVNVVCLLGS
jgi:hypothetical protein